MSAGGQWPLDWVGYAAGGQAAPAPATPFSIGNLADLAGYALGLPLDPGPVVGGPPFSLGNLIDFAGYPFGVDLGGITPTTGHPRFGGKRYIRSLLLHELRRERDRPRIRVEKELAVRLATRRALWEAEQKHLRKVTAAAVYSAVLGEL